MDNIGGPSRPTPQHQPLFWVQQSPTGEWTFGSPEHYQTQPMQIWHNPTNGSNQFPFAGSPQSVTYQTITSPGQSQAIRYYNQTDTNQLINTNKENKTVKVKNKRETIKEHIQLSVQNRFEVLSDEAANESDNESYMGKAVSCREAEGMPSISNDINNERRREENPRILTPTVTNTLAIPKGHEKVDLENKAKNRKPFPMTVITNASIEYNCSVNIILTEHNKQFPDHSTIIKNLKNILKENKFEYDLVKNNELLIVHSQNENSKELLLKTTKLGSLSVMVELRKNKEEFPPISRDQELEIQSDVQTVVKKIIKEIARNPRIFDTSSIPVEEKINSLCKVIEQITNIKISPREINEPELDRAFKVRNESTLNQLILGAEVASVAKNEMIDFSERSLVCSQATKQRVREEASAIVSNSALIIFLFQRIHTP
ncbi:hypothetical protein QYM36_008664 [Artemia franciscana]|uniref:Uncharacterized protein n=1 Tax=Artemia franciscana TaxID=6661 RepID=A0AA88I0R0_ARTSF|nr:hypothetical protein QYM36_008664 [Artemia franciscana]